MITFTQLYKRHLCLYCFFTVTCLSFLIPKMEVISVSSGFLQRFNELIHVKHLMFGTRHLLINIWINDHDIFSDLTKLLVPSLDHPIRLPALDNRDVYKLELSPEKRLEFPLVTLQGSWWRFCFTDAETEAWRYCFHCASQWKTVQSIVAGCCLLILSFLLHNLII